ncbi:MAG TPA: TlpA family protein disulfide reductase [Firmicutes bacterium]|nr:TlpA family protein disulfide reductase [Bacillota bacterium]
MKKIGWIAAAVAFVLVIVGVSVLYQNLSGQFQAQQLIEENPSSQDSTPSQSIPSSQEESAGAEGSTPTTATAPDFTVYTGDGTPVKLSDFRGKPVVLNFWASWCPPCKAEMPDFDAAYQKYTQIQFLMVNATDGSRETVETAQAHVTEQGYSFPVFFDTELSASIAYQATALPCTYFLDENGNLVAQGRGMLSAETLEQGINMILPSEE